MQALDIGYSRETYLAGLSLPVNYPDKRPGLPKQEAWQFLETLKKFVTPHFPFYFEFVAYNLGRDHAHLHVGDEKWCGFPPRHAFFIRAASAAMDDDSSIITKRSIGTQTELFHTIDRQCFYIGTFKLIALPSMSPIEFSKLSKQVSCCTSLPQICAD